MKIVYCIAGTRHSGGMERVLANKANWLAVHGHEVHIVTTDQCGELPFFPLDSSIKCHDLAINYEENNGGSILNKIARYPFKQLKHRRRLSKLLRQLNADVVVSMFCNDASFLHSINDGSSKVLEIHFSRFKRLQYNRKGLWRVIDRIRSASDATTASKYDRFVVLTEEDKSYWGEIDNICVIPNARSFTVEEPASLNNKVVLAVGRLCYQKGFDRLLDIWERICRENSDWKLSIVGTGELKEELSDIIQRKGLGSRVEITSAASAEMPSVYTSASIYVMTSRYEGLPMALIEAQACGLPIVSCDCKCGPKDIISDGVNGYIVKDCDPDVMADKITKLIKDAELRKRMGACAFQDSLCYSEDSIMNRWVALFNSVKK